MNIDIFPGSIHFAFSYGEDSAYFMAGEGKDALETYYNGAVPTVLPLRELRPNLTDADDRYLSETRPVAGTNEDHLAFYYTHKVAMEEILRLRKQSDVQRAGIELGPSDRVVASLRRPFKKGARQPGGTSRADETSMGGVTGLGELLLKILHELEDSILTDSQVSTQGLIRWNDIPSKIGERIDIKSFFNSHSYGSLAGVRPSFLGRNAVGLLIGKWPRSTEISLNPDLLLDPLWCYTSGLYLAEGSTNKTILFEMYKRRVTSLALGFTSSENTSLEFILRALRRLFPEDLCVNGWKVKVGSQYFPELVVIGLKNGVPMLRGGDAGDGKLRTMEISLAVRQWALEVAPTMVSFQHKYSHVEPTGAGVPRVDFWASPALCRWYFPLLMYATFGGIVSDPATEFS